MRQLLTILVAVAVFFIVSMVVHTGLVIKSSGDSAWSERAAATCAMCHGN